MQRNLVSFICKFLKVSFKLLLCYQSLCFYFNCLSANVVRQFVALRSNLFSNQIKKKKVLGLYCDCLRLFYLFVQHGHFNSYRTFSFLPPIILYLKFNKIPMHSIGMRHFKSLVRFIYQRSTIFLKKQWFITKFLNWMNCIIPLNDSRL